MQQIPVEQVPASEFSKHFGRYRMLAQSTPIAVTSHEQITGYFISPRAYDEYLHFKEKSGRAYFAGELPDEVLQDIAAGGMDPRHDHLNDLMDD